MRWLPDFGLMFDHGVKSSRLSFGLVRCVDAFQLEAKKPVSTGLFCSVERPSTVS